MADKIILADTTILIDYYQKTDKENSVPESDYLFMRDKRRLRVKMNVDSKIGVNFSRTKQWGFP